MAKNITPTIQELKSLLKKNKRRLQHEVTQSKELFYLLIESTKRDLTKEELDKVQTQLLDIFKTIPSLAIFMLPGGAILLPLAVKFIPNLLPSAFSMDFDEEE